MKFLAGWFFCGVLFAQAPMPFGIGGGTGSVTHTVGALTAGALAVGNGAGDIQTICPTCTLDANGVLTLNGPGSGAATFNGSTSGSAKLTVAAVAGAPNPLQLPTATCAAGGALVSDGANPQQLSCASVPGNALTSNPLSQFAATTSTQLAGVISDDVGTGSLVFSATSGGSLAANMPWKCTGNSGGTGVNYVCTATLFDGTAIDLSLRDAPVQTQQLVFVPDADSFGSVAIQIGTNNRAARRTTGGNFASGALKANNPYVFSWGPANRWYHAGSFSLTSPNGTVTITGTQFDPGIDITNSILSGTTAAIGGGLLAAGACTAETTTTVTGATTSMVAVASPSATDGTLASAQWLARVSAADTVAVKVCMGLAGTPTAETYNVRVIPAQ